MSCVDLNLAERSYRVTCQDGQEARVRYLNTRIEQKLKFVKTHLRPDDDNHALYLVSLLLADEVSTRNSENSDAEDMGSALAATAAKVADLTEKAEMLAGLLAESREKLRVLKEARNLETACVQAEDIQEQVGQKEEN